MYQTFNHLFNDYLLCYYSKDNFHIIQRSLSSFTIYENASKIYLEAKVEADD